MSTEIKFSLKNLKKKIDKMPKNTIMLKVGFLDAKTAKIAKINEYGAVINVTSKMRGWFYHNFKINKSNKPIIIPPRPFMHTTINNHKNKWRTGLKKLLQDLPAKQALSLLGEKMELDIKHTISNNDFINNAPFTIMKKGRDRPLIDTGNMLNKVAHEIVE